MTKYHVNDKTGKANICRAKNKCPLGSETPHFSSKDEANDYIESALKESSYSFKTVTKSSNESINTFLNLPEDREARWAEEYLEKNLPKDYEVSNESIEGPDYNNDTLVKKGAETFVVRTNGGEWSSFQVVGASRVIPITKEQYKTRSELVKDTKGKKEVNQLLKEVQGMEPVRHHRFSSYDNKKYKVIDDNGSISITGAPNAVIEREDGSKIHCFHMKAVGDRSYTDQPYPVETDVYFSENGERQNSRMMDEGYVIYDDRSGKGVLLKYESGSEVSYQSGEFEFSNNVLKEQGKSRWYDSSGDIYVLDGKEVQEALYYKKA